MSWLVLQTTISIMAVAFLVQMGSAPRRKKLLDAFNVSVMSGFLGIALVAFAFVPSVKATLQFTAFYQPHAYAILIWAAGSLIVLRNRFPPKYFLLTFGFVYALDEFAWNSLAALRFWGAWSTTLSFFFTRGWSEFLVAIVAATSIGYYIVRPKITLNVTFGMLLAYSLLWGWGAGLPVIEVTNAQALVWPYIAYAFTWEVMWQVAFWVFIWGSVFPHALKSTGKAGTAIG
jgi:hypothetical protein